MITWDDGTNSIVESGWWQPHLGGLEADTEVYGTKGYARIWPPEPPSADYEHCTQPMYSAQVARLEPILRRMLDSQAFAAAEQYTRLRERGEPAFSREEIRRALDSD